MIVTMLQTTKVKYGKFGNLALYILFKCNCKFFDFFFELSDIALYTLKVIL